ncbi:hypothetical protein IW261DRAFT_1608073, partial [Armillaria novae-zelandiae]
MDSDTGTSVRSEERITEYCERFRAWCYWKKVMVPRSWWTKKRSASRWFAHSQVSLWYDKVRRRPPIYHERRNLPNITLTA